MDENVFAVTAYNSKIWQYLEPGGVFLGDGSEFPSRSGGHLRPTVGQNFCAKNE